MKTILSKQVNKKAWLKIVEAFFAVLLILGALLIILGRQDNSVEIENEISVLQTNILASISKDTSFREDILATSPLDLSRINVFVETLVPGWMNFSVQVCDYDNICPLDAPAAILENREVYSQSILIFATSNEYNPKQLKIFMWRK